MAGEEQNRGASRLQKSHPCPPPAAAQNPTTAESIPGAASHWTGAAGRGAWGQARLLSRTQHIGLQLCFSFVVGVWGGGWGREGRAILGFWFVPYQKPTVLFFLSFGAKRTNLMIFNLFFLILILKALLLPFFLFFFFFFQAYVVIIAERFNLGDFDSSKRKQSM